METQQQTIKECTLDQWEGNWTLVAVNHLGQHNLTDSAELSHRGEWPAKSQFMDMFGRGHSYSIHLYSLTKMLINQTLIPFNLE